jgi:WhiB family redox-sensing transcriptional regulator
MPHVSPYTGNSYPDENKPIYEEHIADNVWFVYNEQRWVNVDDHIWSWSDIEDPEIEEIEEVQHNIFASLFPSWHINASCLDMNDDIFFGGDGTPENPSMTPSRIRQAKEICRLCIVRKDCIVASLNFREEYGIWGGITANERMNLFNFIDNGTKPEKIAEDYIHGLSYKYGAK